MSTLLYGVNRDPVPPDEAEIRSTTNVINDDAPPAEQSHSPAWNEFESDPDTEGGLTTRQLGSYTIPRERGVNPALAEANAPHNSLVNDRISSDGTAAAREAEGQWGHGTMQTVEGIEPTIVDGHAFGETYFKADRPDNPSTSGVSPAANTDPGTAADAQSTGEVNSRIAVQNSMYSAFLRETTGIG